MEKRTFKVPEDFAVVVLAVEGSLIEKGGDGLQVELLSVRKGERKGALYHCPPCSDVVVNLQGLEKGPFIGRISCSGLCEDRSMFREDPEVRPGERIKSKKWPLVYIGGNLL